MPTIICPHCRAELVQEKKTYHCEQNHCFDLAKEGYLNLLPVNKKKSKEPGDNDLMIAARRDFLEQGFYNPLIEAIRSTIQHELGFEKKKFIALDSGCGEGYYTERALKNANRNSQIFGTDISKYAVKNAAKKYKDIFFFVSSAYHLPIETDSIDLVLSVFSPNDPIEFHRVLKKDGFLVITSPAENHMKQLAELIYNDFRPHEHNIADDLASKFELHLAKRVSFDIHVQSSAALQALHKMTPYYYNTSKEGQDKVANCNNINITCDFHLSIFKPLKAL
ncbi:methyltransferase domain-containing protein [Vicingaceae bacterium]|nr:methyltransferase domain-containing protein [Vicingaceae bacterium]